MKFKNLIYGLLAIGVIGLIVYRINSNASNGKNSPGPGDKGASTLVTGIVVRNEDFSNELSLSGSIDANEQIDLRSEVSGIVEAIYFTEGSHVTKGQVLFKVNDAELKAQLSQAATKEGLAAENARRAKLLLEKEAISQEEYDVARADWSATTAQTQLIRAQISKTSVKAPFAGKVGLRSISPGTYITPTLLVAKLSNTEKLKITFSIPEKYATQVQQGASITFTVSGSNTIHTAKIYALEPQVEVSTRTLQVRAITNNTDGQLLPGTFADIKLPLNSIKDAIVIPSEAIVPVQNGKKVYIANQGKAKEVMIETATRTASSTVVIKGLQAGDTLVTSGVMSLKNDSPLKIQIKK